MNTSLRPNVLCLWKPVGWTPLETVRALQEKNPKYASVKVGYAGRLDPMAAGVLLVLIGEENKQRKQYEQLPKEYVFDMLFGIATDSYDLLGLITTTALPQTHAVLKPYIPEILKRFTGTITQQYPPYCSKPVNGKPLYWWARNNRLSAITIPIVTRIISSLTVQDIYSLSTEELRCDIKQRIDLVKGKFRQKEILDRWAQFFRENTTAVFPVMRFKTTVSSGTYIRSLVHAIGNHLNTPAMTLNLTRTKVGPYETSQTIVLNH